MEIKSVFKGKEAIMLTKNIENAINVSYLIEASLSLLHDKPFYWNLRSTPTKIEKEIRKKNKLNPIAKAEWARYDIRDLEIPLMDAILLASWIRSRVAAHKFSDFIGSLSMYDASNVHFLQEDSY